MAQRVVTSMEDDIDGGPADVTVTFSLDGRSYQIDLSNKNAKGMREKFAPFVEHARRASRAQRTSPTQRAVRTVRDRKKSADMRAWAKSQGIEVSERGRIPASVMRDYEKSHS
jgi:nucleoid-associated protein Lsr2